MNKYILNRSALLLIPSFLCAQLDPAVAEIPTTTKPVLGQPFNFIFDSPTIGKYETPVFEASSFCESHFCYEKMSNTKTAKYHLRISKESSWLYKNEPFLTMYFPKGYVESLFLRLPLRESKNITPDEIKLMSDFIKSAVKMNISQKKIEKCYTEAINSMKIQFGGPEGVCYLKKGSITRIDSKKMPFGINVHAGLDMGTGMYQAQLNIFIDDRKEK